MDRIRKIGLCRVPVRKRHRAKSRRPPYSCVMKRGPRHGIGAVDDHALGPTAAVPPELFPSFDGARLPRVLAPRVSDRSGIQRHYHGTADLQYRGELTIQEATDLEVAEARSRRA